MCLAVVQLVMESMKAKGGDNLQLRMLVPSALCGTIIGKSGSIIRGFSEDSKAGITVSSQDRQPPGVPDRVVRIIGNGDSLMRATALLLSKLSEHPHFGRYLNPTLTYPPNFDGSRPGGGRRHPGGAPGDNTRLEITIGVPESRVGAPSSLLAPYFKWIQADLTYMGAKSWRVWNNFPTCPMSRDSPPCCAL